MRVSLGLAAGLLALSCAGRAGGLPKVGIDQDIVREPSDSLRISLDLAREVRTGEPVPIAIRLENTGKRPLDLYLRGRTIAFDIFVNRPDGTVVWQRLENEIIPAIIQLKVLQPGEVVVLKDKWTQRDNQAKPVAPGSYVVRGAVLTDGLAPLETPPASLRVLPQ